MTNEEFQKAVLQEFKGLKQDIGDLKQDFSTLKQDVGTLKHDVTDLKQDVSTLKHNVTDLKQDVDKIDKTLKIVYDHVGTLTEFRTEVNMKLNSILEDNKSIHELLGEHEVSIRTMRRRPV